MVKRSRKTAIAGMFLAASLIAACGSDDPEATGDSPGSEAQGPITIGVLNSLTGPYGQVGGETKKTLDLLVEQLNADGGIDGRDVKLEYSDDRTDPTQAALALRDLAEKEPAALLGPIISSSCSAVIDEIEKQEIPTVTMCATDTQVNPIRDYGFMSTLPTPGMVEQLTNYLESEGVEKVAVLHDSGDFGKSGIAEIKEQGRLDVVGEASYQLQSTTFVPQLTSLLQNDPGAVIVWGAGAPLVTIAKEFNQLGSEVPMLFPASAASPSFLEPAGAAAEGMIMASSLTNVVEQVPDDHPSKQKILALEEAYEEKYDEPLSQNAANVCGAWAVVTEAIRAAGSTEPQAVRDAIEENGAIGCHGTYQYTPEDHRGLDADDVWVTEVRNGELVATEFSVNKPK